MQPSFIQETSEGLFYATIPSGTDTSLMKFDIDGSFLQTVATVEGTALTLLTSQERGLILATSLSTDAVRVHIFVDDLLLRYRTFHPEGESDIASVHLLSQDGIVLIEHEAPDRPRLIAWNPRTDRVAPFPLPAVRNPVFAGILAPDRPVLIEPVKSRLLRIHILGPDGAVFHSFPRRIRPLTLQGRLLDPACPVGEHLFELRLSAHRLRLIPLL